MTYSPAFFETCAQLIPVVGLALVVEKQLRSADADGTERVLRSWCMFALLAGEALSLAVVGGGIGPSRAAGSLVAVALTAVGMLAMAALVSQAMEDAASRNERVLHVGAFFAALAAMVWMLLEVLVL